MIREIVGTSLSYGMLAIVGLAIVGYLVVAALWLFAPLIRPRLQGDDDD